MYDLTHFSQDDMLKCAVELRNLSVHAGSMEEVAKIIVSYLYKSCRHPKTGESALALVRFFKTHAYGELPLELQHAALDILKGSPVPDSTKCLTLLGSAGDEPHWNYKEGSSGHKSIPLASEDFVSAIPMISRLIQQFGLEISTVLEPMPSLLVESDRKIHSTFIFHVPKALDSQYIPAQESFVIPYGVKSVLGFGGLLASGNLFVVIMFSKAWIPPETAKLFRWISTYVWVAITLFDQKAVFADSKLPKAELEREFTEALIQLQRSPVAV